MLRAPVRGLAEGTHPAPAELVHYVCTVHRSPSGEIVAFDPAAGTEADARVERTASGDVLHVGPLRRASVVATRRLVVVQGLAKGDKCDAIVRDAAELGATDVALTVMARSVARPLGDKLLARADRWQRIADEAARQAGRGDAPRVSVHDSLDGALTTATVDEAGLAGFVLYEGPGGAPLGPALRPALARGDGIVFVVGPEGGLAPEEVERCRAAGMRVTTLGAFVLRTETVVAAVLGAVRVLEQDH
ncbi:MAG: RsmE family RNA methyltransferase [Polyangiaceae bacterium]